MPKAFFFLDFFMDFQDMNSARIFRFHFLFEQSGTFKNAAKALGHKAWDYDIEDGFGETDIKVDLFSEIKKCYYRKASIFDGMYPGEYVFAFFPCIRFSSQYQLILGGNHYGGQGKTDLEKAMDALGNHDSLAQYMRLLNMLVVICLERKLRLVIENPYRNSYLLRYWCFKPSIVITNRRMFGDYYEKPTMFFTFGFEPYDNVVFKCFDQLPKRKVVDERGFSSSEISPQFAEYFLKAFLLPMEVTINGQ